MGERLVREELDAVPGLGEVQDGEDGGGQLVHRRHGGLNLEFRPDRDQAGGHEARDVAVQAQVVHGVLSDGDPGDGAEVDGVVGDGRDLEGLRDDLALLGGDLVPSGLHDGVLDDLVNALAEIGDGDVVVGGGGDHDFVVEADLGALALHGLGEDGELILDLHQLVRREVLFALPIALLALAALAVMTVIGPTGMHVMHGPFPLNKRVHPLPH